MSREIEIWNFIADRLRAGERVALLVVAESQGSSPGRAGYKMAVAENGQLMGSIGGGVMEVNLVEQAKQLFSVPPAVPAGITTQLVKQEHRKNADHPSGMICSGSQTIIFKQLLPDHLPHVETITERAFSEGGYLLIITHDSFSVGPDFCGTRKLDPEYTAISFRSGQERDFTYCEELNVRPQLDIIGGGHCALALSELMSKMNFSIRIFDDRPELNTLEKNEFADEITIIDSYEEIGDHVGDGHDAYIVVMTLGYRTDEIVIRRLLGRQFKYFGVLGSKAKMATLLRSLRDEGFPKDQINAIRTPIGIPINSQSPEEIAVSIAAEIISVKNA